MLQKSAKIDVSELVKSQNFPSDGGRNDKKASKPYLHCPFFLNF